MLILDAYNVMGSPMPPMLAGLDERGLCGALVRSGLATERDPAVVVCDGGVKPGGPGVSPVVGVELVYAGGVSADDVIVGMVQAHTNPRSVTVVTSDRTIQKMVRRRRVAVMSSGRFIGVLASALGQGGVGGGGVGGSGGDGDGEGKRMLPLSEEEAKGWLDEFGF